MYQPDDEEMKTLLQQLAVPEADDAALSAIAQQARETRPKRLRLFKPLRQLRAMILVPQTSRLIAISVILLFMGIGLIGRLSEPRQMIAPYHIPEDMLLIDIELIEQDPLEDFWMS